MPTLPSTQLGSRSRRRSTPCLHYHYSLRKSSWQLREPIKNIRAQNCIASVLFSLKPLYTSGTNGSGNERVYTIHSEPTSEQYRFEYAAMLLPTKRIDLSLDFHMRVSTVITRRTLLSGAAENP